MTRKPVRAVVLLPDVRRDPQGWFKLVDMDGDGRLSRKEVLEVFKAQLPIDWRKLEREAEAGDLWRIWDRDGSGFLEENELMGGEGLVAYVTAVFGGAVVVAAIPGVLASNSSIFAVAVRPIILGTSSRRCPLLPQTLRVTGWRGFSTSTRTGRAP